MHKEPFLKMSKRDHLAWQKRLLVRIVALILSLIVCAGVIFALVRMNPLDVYKAIWDGALGSERRVWQDAERYHGASVYLPLALAPRL